MKGRKVYKRLQSTYSLGIEADGIVLMLKKEVLHSAFINGSLCLEYKPGKTTTPEVGKLFAFKDIKSARRFAWGDEVWECEATGVKALRRRIIDCEPDILQNATRYWNGQPADRLVLNEFNTSNGPSGTILCDSITPIRKIERDELWA